MQPFIGGQVGAKVTAEGERPVCTVDECLACAGRSVMRPGVQGNWSAQSQTSIPSRSTR